MPFKICQQCKKQVGPRTQNCECGYSFAKSEKKPKENLAKSISTEIEVKQIDQVSTASTKGSVFAKIATPAGRCPIVPEGYNKGWPDGPATDNAVVNWAINVSRLFDGRMTVEAVVYYARQFWEINGSEYRERILDLIKMTLQPQSNQEFMEKD